MRVKQFITWMLLSVYLLAVAGPAMCSLSCKCVAMQSRTNHSSHICSCCCGHEHDNLHAGCDRDISVAKANSPEQVKAPCCRNHHSTEIDLYTGNQTENERYIRLLIIDLPAALIPKSFDFVVAALPYNRLGYGAIPDLLQAHARSAGLRAPPVLA